MGSGLDWERHTFKFEAAAHHAGFYLLLKGAPIEFQIRQLYHNFLYS